MQLIQHETWDVLDSTKLEEYERCHRRYFWRYIVGWVPGGGTNIHLAFGQAIHKAMDVFVRHEVISSDYVSEAYEAFCTCFLANGLTLDGAGPKTAGNAQLLLRQYAVQYEGESLKGAGVEVSGLAPISHNAALWCNLDCVLVDPKSGLYVIKDYKTTTQFSNMWLLKWELWPQFSAYIHALACVVPFEKIAGLQVDGLIVRASKSESGKSMGNQLIRPPLIIKSRDDLQHWVDETLGIIDDLELDRFKLAQWMSGYAPWRNDCFRRCPYEACTSYHTPCPYHRLCTSGRTPENLLKSFEEPPGEYVQRYWDPRNKDAVTEEGV